MGRKTFESIGKPLPNRINLVVSRDPTFKPEGVHVFHSIMEALNFVKGTDETELMIIGGEALFTATELIDVVDKVYLTRVEADVEGDVIFCFDPKPEDWEQVGLSVHQDKNERNEYPFTHYVYKKKV